MRYLVPILVALIVVASGEAFGAGKLKGGSGRAAQARWGESGKTAAEPGSFALGKVPHPLDGMSRKAIERRLKKDPASLGSVSLGRTNAGALFNAVQIHKSPRWRLVDPEQSYATAETISYLSAAIDKVHREFPKGTPPIYVGDLSLRKGGPFRPHESHQSGRDADIGFYYLEKERWYTRGRKSNLDLPRTWELLRALITETDVERIFLDRRLQRVIRAHAAEIGEDAEWLANIFDGKDGAGVKLREGSLIRHEPGHATHLHVRFYSPVAQESGRRVYASLRKLGLIKPPVYYIKHRVRRGQTLGHLARKYRTSVKAIQRANRLRSTVIRANRKYKIPRRGWVKNVSGPVKVAPRRLPPDDWSHATADGAQDVTEPAGKDSGEDS